MRSNRLAMLAVIAGSALLGFATGGVSAIASQDSAPPSAAPPHYHHHGHGHRGDGGL